MTDFLWKVSKVTTVSIRAPRPNHLPKGEVAIGNTLPYSRVHSMCRTNLSTKRDLFWIFAFESRPKHRLQWLKIFLVFVSLVPLLGQNLFLSNPFQLIQIVLTPMQNSMARVRFEAKIIEFGTILWVLICVIYGLKLCACNTRIKENINFTR